MGKKNLQHESLHGRPCSEKNRPLESRKSPRKDTDYQRPAFALVALRKVPVRRMGIAQKKKLGVVRRGIEGEETSSEGALMTPKEARFRETGTAMSPPPRGKSGGVQKK